MHGGLRAILVVHAPASLIHLLDLGEAMPVVSIGGDSWVEIGADYAQLSRAYMPNGSSGSREKSERATSLPSDTTA